MISRLRFVSVGGAVAAVLVVGACSPSSADFQSAAEDAIEGDIAEQSSLGELSATCDEPDDPEPGDVFACTATTEDGRTVEFTATVEEDDRVNVVSTNIFQITAEDLIEGEIAEQSSLGELSATCEEPDDPEPGDVFACTATTEDGRTIELTATVEEDDQVNVESTNLITVDGLGTIEEVAVAALEAEIGEPLGVENFDCGSEPIIIDVTEEYLICTLTDPASGEVYDAQVDIPALDDVGSLTVRVAAAPRG